MKVALLLFGQPRYLEDGQSLKTYKNNVLDKYDVDVFGHMWFYEGIQYDTSTWTKNAGFVRCDSVTNTVDIFRQTMSPKGLDVERPVELDLSEQISAIHSRFPGADVKDIGNIYSQLKSIQCVVRLFQGFDVEEYDFVILSRYDLLLVNFPNLFEMEKNYLYLSDHHDFADLIMVFGNRFLGWISNVFDDSMRLETIDSLQNHYYPEGFKKATFLKYFTMDDLRYVGMQSFTIRK